eukprot:TRINITY_DN12762_c0_g1_i1.p1 TRINITY_DN12762_c0_g1~~TRINITY_DN12762_c0_g1_i1.p1  ORF type:complete len:1081 (-),score=206.26 TRINITY_DN12762_c0_g1_i1:6-3248(-)
MATAAEDPMPAGPAPPPDPLPNIEEPPIMLQAKKQKADLHRFRIIIRNLQVRNVMPWGGISSSPVIRFIVGAPALDLKTTEPLPPDLEFSEVKALDIWSKPFKNLPANGTASWDIPLIHDFEITYEQLPTVDCLIELYHYRFVLSNQFMGSARVSLFDLATGSVQQEHKMEIHDKRLHQTSGILSCLIYFQEVTHFVMHFQQWQAFGLEHETAGTKLEPYIHFKIRRDWRKFFRKGGFFFRQTTSPTESASETPTWHDAGVVTYYGIRSELEDEELQVKVYHFDLTGKNKLVGFVSIPMRGVIEYGYVDAELGLPIAEGSTQLKRTGRIEGYIAFDGLTPHQQFGEVVIMKPGRAYLVVKVQYASRLKPPKGKPLTDGFVVVSWNGVKQETKVIKQTVNPQFDDVLVFPLRFVHVSAEALAETGPISVQVFHKSDDGNDYLGGFELPLDLLTPAGGGAAYSGTGGFEGEVKLNMFGQRTEQSVKLRAYFHPGLKSIIPVPPEPSSVRLREQFAQRGAAWQSKLPVSKARPFQYDAQDENGIVRFIPEYMMRLKPPLSFQDPLQIARMVHCITFESDQDALSQEDVWSSPNFFMTLKKGDSEDRAVVLCNLFLGLDKDAYVCVGRNKHGDTHTWVMTREPDGSVIFWETLNGKGYKLPLRWTPPPPPVLAADIGGRQSLLRPSTQIAWTAQDPVRDLPGVPVVSDLSDSEEEMSGSPRDDGSHVGPADDDATAPSSQPTTPTDAPVKNPLRAAPSRNPLTVLSAVGRFAGRLANKAVGTVARPARTQTVIAEPIAGDDEPICFFDDDVMYKPDKFDREPETWSERLRLAGIPSHAQFKSDYKPSPAEQEFDGFEEIPEVEPDRPLPYLCIDVVANNRNLWGNFSHADPGKCTFNLDDAARWLSFLDKEFSPEIRPFFIPRRLAPPIPRGRLDILAIEIYKSVSSGVAMIRNRANRDTTFVRALREPISQGLEIMEYDWVTPESQKGEIDNWISRLQSHTPVGYKFYGVPVHLNYSDLRRIQHYFVEKCPEIHDEEDEKVMFACGVHCTSYWSAVISVWVMLVKLLPVSVPKQPQSADDAGQ